MALLNLHRWRQLWHSPWLLRLLLGCIAASGIINLWLALQAPGLTRSSILVPALSFEQLATSRLVSGYSGLLLLLLLPGLLRRQRSAWWLALGLLGLSAGFNVLAGLGLVPALVELVLWLILLAKRRSFVVPVTRPVLRRLVLGLGFVIVLTLVYGLVGLARLTNYDAQLQSWQLLGELGLALLGRSQLVGQSRFSSWFLASIAIVFWSGVLLALLRALSPLALKGLAPLGDRLRAEALVETYGRSSLAHFTLLGEKHYYFLPDDQAFVAYTVENGMGLALGDPIGEPQAIRQAIEGFRVYCLQQNWKPVFCQVLPDHLGDYRQAGFYTLPMGQEAIVDLAQFSTSGKTGKNFRAASNQLQKAGYQARYYPPPQSDALIAALKQVSDAWLAGKHGSEKAFSLGVFEHDYIKHTPLMVLENSQGQPVAFANLVSEFQRNELTLDLMRSLEGLPEDTMLALFVAILIHAKVEGYDSFNLGLAALSGLRSGPEAAFEERALATIFERFNQFYNFKGLAHFKNKLHPYWEMRYLVYPARTDLLQTLTAVALADSSLGFWGEVRQELRKRLDERREERQEKQQRASPEASVSETES